MQPQTVQGGSLGFEGPRLCARGYGSLAGGVKVRCSGRSWVIEGATVVEPVEAASPHIMTLNPRHERRAEYPFHV